MILHGLTDFFANVSESPAECHECSATTRLGNGLCLSCTLRQGLVADREASREAFEAILTEDEVQDTQWRVGNYEILEEIGRGGMGVIYRARQRHSRRIVAVKRMVSYHADSRETLERFRREAEAAASLDHPNILPIYEVGQGEDGLPFFSMKYAAGGSLQKASHALRNRPRECVELMTKVARAVQYAHERGILHRDLKPGNILLDGRGESFVTDFGLAKWLDTTTDLTRTLTIFGTPGYIAPEQAKGPTAKLTPAADVYSLGAVLFELFTGRPPFLGEHALGVIQQASEKLAPKLRSFAPVLDRDLETICARCLEREPHARYRSAGDLAVDLERWLEGCPIVARRVSPPVRAWRWSRRNPKLAMTTAVAVCSATAAALLFFSHKAPPRQLSLSDTISSVAVLPLKNATGNPENEYLADGLTEALISALSKTEGLKVISRGSVFAFKGKQIDPRDVGRQLGVMTIMEGDLVESEGAARVAVQLVSATDGRLLWSGENFDSFSNVFRLENELIRSVAAAIRPNLGNEQESRITKRYTESPEAYQLYLKGRYFWNERTEADIRKAIHYFNYALEKDPNYALAYAGLADSYALLNYYDGSAPTDSFPKARDLAEKAVKIDDTLSEAHAALAYVKRAYDWDWTGAEREFKRAIELDPNYATAHFWYGEHLTYLGRFDEGIAEIRRAEELDPLSPIISGSVGWALHMARQPDPAIEQLHRTLELDPDFAMTHFYLGMAYEGKQMYNAAIDEYRKSADLSPLGPGIVGLGHAYAVSGMRDQARKVLDELMKRVGKNQARPTTLAIVYAGLKDGDHAFEWMEKAYEQRAEGVVYLKAQPYFDNLRSDPRRAAFLQRIGLGESSKLTSMSQATSAQVKTIAVLPFEILEANPTDEYLGTGMADTLITQIGRIPEILARPLSAVQKYAESRTQDPLAAGRELRAEVVLDGTIQREADKLRVTARLLRTLDGALLWSGKFDEQFTKVFEIEDSISQEVARAFIQHLSSEDRKLLTKRYTDNPEAYRAYLKGRYFWNKRTPAALEQSLGFFRQALDLDPTYASAYAGMADAYALLVWQEQLPRNDFIERAKAAAIKALQIDQTLAEPHATLGYVKFWYDWDFAGAELEFRRAIELNPDYGTAHHWYGEALGMIGRFEDGIKELRLAQQVDPLSPIINADLGKLLFLARQPDQAIEQLRSTLELDPDLPLAHVFLGLAYNKTGLHKKAIAELERIAKAPDSRAIFKATLGFVYGQSGREAEARTILGELIGSRLSRHYVSPFHIALVYVGLGENDKAIEWLETAKEERDPFLMYIEVDPNFDTLRTDARFVGLIKQISAPAQIVPATVHSAAVSSHNSKSALTAFTRRRKL